MTGSSSRSANAGDLPEIVGVRVFSQYLLGDRGIEALWDLQWLVVAGMPILALAALAFLGASTWRACTERVVAAAGLTLLAVALLVVPVWGRGTNHGAIEFPQETILGPVPQAGEYNPGPSHFSIAPVLVLGGALAVLVSADHRSRRARQLLGAAFVAHLVVVGAFGFRVTNGRSAGPEWLPTVETARKGCEGRPPNEVAELALPQPFFNPPIRVTCDELTG